MRDLNKPVSENEQNTFNVNLEIVVNTYDEIQEAVKFANNIQKEYSCHCTLSVKIA